MILEELLKDLKKVFDKYNIKANYYTNGLYDENMHLVGYRFKAEVKCLIKQINKKPK